MEILNPVRLNCVVDADRIALTPMSEPNQYAIMDTHTGQCLGTVTQPRNASHQVELFWGKGGFMTMISSPAKVRYFALPGATITVQDVSVHLEGEPITANPSRQPARQTAFHPQQVSPQATILGAGLATRFERISGDSTQYSKPAVPLCGRTTVIECIANQLAKHGFSHLIVNTFFKPESLKAGLARSQAEKVDYIDETEPSGTAGGLRKMLMEPQWKGLLDETKPLLVVQGDAVTDADFSALMQAHLQHDALVTIGCQEVAECDVDKFGIIVTDVSDADGLSGRILEFQEKPARELAKSRLGNTGFYLFSPQAYPLIVDIYEAHLRQVQDAAKAAGLPIPTEAPFDFANDLFPAILKRSKEAGSSLPPFRAQQVTGYWSDIGNPVQYLESVHDIYTGKVSLPLPENLDYYYRNGVIFWHGTQEIADAEGAELSGNVVVALHFQG